MKVIEKFLKALFSATAMLCMFPFAMCRLLCQSMRKWWKRRSKLFRCLTKTLFIVLILGIVAMGFYDDYDYKYGRNSYYDVLLSENVKICYYRNDKYRVYNLKTKEYTTPKINWVSSVPENDSLTVYAIGNKRGFLNVKNGEIIIDVDSNNYSNAWVFSEGLAAVVRNGKIGFINAKNEIVIPFKYCYFDKYNAYDFGYLFHNDCCVITNEKGKFGLINKKGEWILNPIYDKILPLHENGYRLVVNKEKYGVIDSNNNIVYPTEYDYIDIVSNGFVLAKEGKMWQIDFSGKVTKPFMYEMSEEILFVSGYTEDEYPIHTNSDYAKYEILGLYGILNSITGKPITPAKYSEVSILSKNIFEVQDKESGNWYLLDKNGNIINKNTQRQ
ncbi:MAG: WG repeat-containing protein [Bacteroidales bacterium]|nr:WG repeat-containing protein [Bacteroidales bacterium]